MESKDEDVVRFSDLIRKGAVKKERTEKDEAPEMERKPDEGPLRFSDLDALKLKRRPVGQSDDEPKESKLRPEKEMAEEGKSIHLREDVPDDLEEYKKIKSKDILKPPSGVTLRDRDKERSLADSKIRTSAMAMPFGGVPRETVDLEKKEIPLEGEKKEPQKPDSMVIEPTTTDVKKLYNEARNCLQSIKEKVIAKQRFDIQQPMKIVAQMVESRDQIEALYPLTTMTIEEEDYNISHQTNVTIYAIKLGFGLGFSTEKLHELGFCSLLHDLGMFRIPDGIRLKREKLTGHESDIIKTHTDIGREILSSFSGSHPTLSMVAYEHHEREGGQGYPRGLQGNDIHEYARIVAITDSYEAMTHNRPYRRALLQPLSAKELIKQRNALFAPFVIKVFLQEISLYPPGSYVILNNKAIAEVVTNEKNNPLRPDVRILFDGEGNKVKNDVFIRLAQNPLFFIVEGILPEEIPGQKSK